MPYPDAVARKETTPECGLDPSVNNIGFEANAHTYRATENEENEAGEPLLFAGGGPPAVTKYYRFSGDADDYARPDLNKSFDTTGDFRFEAKIRMDTVGIRQMLVGGVSNTHLELRAQGAIRWLDGGVTFDSTFDPLADVNYEIVIERSGGNPIMTITDLDLPGIVEGPTDDGVSAGNNSDRSLGIGGLPNDGSLPADGFIYDASMTDGTNTYIWAVNEGTGDQLLDTGGTNSDMTIQPGGFNEANWQELP